MATAVRDIIRINEELCDGCGDCVGPCKEGALEIVDGKARLKGDILCDGAGACLGHCPTGALTIEKRLSEDYDEKTVAANLHLQASRSARSTPVAAATSNNSPLAAQAGGCPGSAMRQWGNRQPAQATGQPTTPATAEIGRPSQLAQWPVQLMLLPPTAPCFQNADLLIAADCVPFAHANFHEKFLKGRALVVGCPKLDDLPHYFDKLTQIFQANELNSVEVIKMEVPCCGGIAQAAIEARQRSGTEVPLTITTISLQGDLLDSIKL